MADRNPQEPGYFLVNPFYDVQIWLDHYFALASTAEAYIDYFIDYRLENNSYVGFGESHPGSIDGAVTLVNHDIENNRSFMFGFTMGGNFDPILAYANGQLRQPECSWNNYSDPTLTTSDYFFVSNLWKSEQYINTENGLRSSPIKSRDWVSARWDISQISGTNRYSISSILNGIFPLYMDTQNSNVLTVGNLPNTLPPAASQWLIEPVGQGSSNFRIRNFHDDSFYLAIENQADDDPNDPTYELSLHSNHQNHWLSSQWRFCAANN